MLALSDTKLYVVSICCCCNLGQCSLRRCKQAFSKCVDETWELKNKHRTPNKMTSLIFVEKNIFITRFICVLFYFTGHYKAELSVFYLF